MKAKYRKLYDDLYIIKDYCNCYLLIGSERALLVDTGMGMVNLKGAVAAITDKPLTVINTHAHIDHFGGNHRFEEVLIHEKDKDVGELHNSAPFREYLIHSAPMILRAVLKGKVKNPTDLRYKYVNENYVIDLGDRCVRIIWTPGHTKGSICLFDEKTGYMFGGDTLVPNLVLLNLDYSDTPAVFEASMRKLKSYEPRITHVFPGHHSDECDKSLVDIYLDVCKTEKKEHGTITHDVTGMKRIVDNGKVHIECKISYNYGEKV
jgi:glyoxylase-like metal-dependent hydrolase (beta-lactamase superfamily II)